ncbi:phage tail protein [Paraburkholderia sp. J67]|uniref:phage tail protein n=1 Tax=Paraburkholderia sp. J67 TaxID=2805435 RepID=UPI002ABE3E30|nr:phage tail protein [Paraburkholderia sp. J67]
MAGEVQDQSIWPLPKFYFSVDIGDQQNLAFQEVTGLETEKQVIEYRAGNSKQFSTVKMPGIGKVGNVTLKKGIFVKDNKFWDWFSQIKMNVIKRVPVVIKLLDEQGGTTMVWTLTNAFPVKITGTDLKSDGNEVAVETLELAHEGLTIENK